MGFTLDIVCGGGACGLLFADRIALHLYPCPHLHLYDRCPLRMYIMYDCCFPLTRCVSHVVVFVLGQSVFPVYLCELFVKRYTCNNIRMWAETRLGICLVHERATVSLFRGCCCPPDTVSGSSGGMRFGNNLLIGQCTECGRICRSCLLKLYLGERGRDETDVRLVLWACRVGLVRRLKVQGCIQL